MPEQAPPRKGGSGLRALLWVAVSLVGLGTLAAGGCVLLFMNAAATVADESQRQQTQERYVAALTMEIDCYAERDRNYITVTGVITNRGSRPVDYVKVKTDILQKDRVVDSDWSYAVDSSPLGPHESRSWKQMIRAVPGEFRYRCAVMTE